MSKKSPHVLLVLLLIALPFVTAALPPIPEVGPGVCAWRQPNGQRCDESIQRCAEGCPPLGAGPSFVPSPVSLPSPAPRPEPTIMSCSSAVSYCISDCRRSDEAASLCLVRCIAGKMANRREMVKCLQRMNIQLPGQARAQAIEGNVQGLSKEITTQLVVINNVFYSETGRNGYVTSGHRDWKPGDRFSYHQTGDAIDLRINHLKLREQIKVFQKMKKRLGSTYDVCLELPDITEARKLLGENVCLIGKRDPHIHVEYDRHRAKRTLRGEVPPPIVTRYELPAEEKEITIPRLVQKLNEAFGQKTVLYEQTLQLPEGLDIRVSTSEKDLVLWGAMAVGKEVAVKVAKYAIPENVLAQLKRELDPVHEGWETVSSVYEISQVEPKVSGNYAVGPFTVEVRYMPELLPEHYGPKDVGLFHVIVEGQKAKIKRLQNTFVDPVKRVIFGKTEGFSMFVVAVMPEKASPVTGASVYVKYLPQKSPTKRM
ncbi:hypothetical protein HY639_04630 [Candidatus Woesearchaeota archaeon]|nr:hypothetical protein [Candidatus Woesearchaeota archaeon]